MIRRHPALCVVAAIYFVALALLCLTPNSLVARGSASIRRLVPWATASGAEAVISLLLFVPVGVLLVLITGRRKWVTVLVIGVLASCWLRLAEMVWMPREHIGVGSVMPHVVGTAVGVALAITLLAMRRRSLRRRPVTQLSALAQRS
jgi:cyanate permease